MKKKKRFRGRNQGWLNWIENKRGCCRSRGVCGWVGAISNTKVQSDRSVIGVSATEILGLAMTCFHVLGKVCEKAVSVWFEVISELELAKVQRNRRYLKGSGEVVGLLICIGFSVKILSDSNTKA